MYYRLGLTYPRTALREVYPQRRPTRRLAFSGIVSTGINKSLNQTLNLTQTATTNALIKKTLTSTLNFTQTAKSNLLSASINQTLTLTQSVALVRQFAISNTITFTQSLSNTNIHIVSASASNAITFTQNFTYVRPLGRILQSNLVLTQSVNRISNLEVSVHQALNLTQTLKRQAKYNLRCVSQLDFQINSIKRNFGLVSVSYPDVIAVIPRNYVVLRGFQRLIVLPSPLFGDSEQLVASQTLNRAVDGTLYSYVKSTNRRRLTYKFRVERQKAYELESFANIHNLNHFELGNWKGEIWWVKLIDNPLIFTAFGRGERQEVSMTFEGYRIA